MFYTNVFSCLLQTCVAPDYVLCTKYVLISPFSHKINYFFFKRSTRDKFLDHIRRVHPQFFGSDAAKSSDLCRIVNDRNYQRITRLLDNTKGKASNEYFVQTSRSTCLWENKYGAPKIQNACCSFDFFSLPPLL